MRDTGEAGCKRIIKPNGRKNLNDGSDTCPEMAK